MISNELCEIWTARHAADQKLEKQLDDLANSQGADFVFELALSERFFSLIKSFYGNIPPDADASGWWVEVCSSVPIGVEAPFPRDELQIEFQEYLDQIRDIVVSRLSNLIKIAIFEGALPKTGLVLYFTRQLTNSFIVEYRTIHQVVEVNFTSSINGPKAIFDMSDISRLPGAKARNNAKTFIQSGHKAIIHNDILTHVDRRSHVGVFGPTIDTLLLSELLRRFGNLEECTRFLEIGVGSGHIMNSALQFLGPDAEVFGIDIHARSIICTYENLERCRKSSDHIITGNVDLTIGRFDPSDFAKKFDLIVCNPPYISIPDGLNLPHTAAYKDAISGTEMLKGIVDAADTLLTECGVLLIMISSTTEAFDRMSMPNLDAKVLSEHEMTVPFDLEAVYAEPTWTEYLIEKGLIWQNGDIFHHKLRPIMITRSRE